MIFKSELIDAINDLSHDLSDLAIKISNQDIKIRKLENKLASIRSSKKEPSLDNAISSAKSKKAKTQPRSKDGKFTKGK